jgi:hypothetical protein
MAIRADGDRVGSLQFLANSRKLVALRSPVSRMAII